MKHFLLPLLLFFLLGHLRAQEITFAESSHDFGEVEEAEHQPRLPFHQHRNGTARHQASDYRMRMHLCQMEQGRLQAG